MSTFKVILNPVLTEKSTENAQKKVYCFEVSEDSNKNQIKETLEKMYEVTVNNVKTMIRKGKEKRVGKKGKSKMMPPRKIAYVTLKKGTLDLFPQS